MTLGELLENIEVQGEQKIVYYDEVKNERVEVSDISQVEECTILYIYPEKDTLFIEIEFEA